MVLKCGMKVGDRRIPRISGLCEETEIGKHQIPYQRLPDRFPPGIPSLFRRDTNEKQE